MADSEPRPVIGSWWHSRAGQPDALVLGEGGSSLTVNAGQMGAKASLTAACNGNGVNGGGILERLAE